MANIDEADEIPKTDLERFQDLEVAAWEWNGKGKKGGQNGVRTHAKKIWNASTTDRELLSELLRTYYESRRKVEAIRDEIAPAHGDLGSSAVQRFAIVQSQRQYRDALAGLIAARRANKLTNHERAVTFLEQCQTDNDQALSQPIPENVEVLARCKEEFDRCQNLALELPQDITEAENLGVFIDNCREVLYARDELDEVLEVNYGKIKGSDEETNDAEGYLDSLMTQNEAAKKEIEQRMEKSLTDTDKNLKSARANPPDADAQDVEALTGYISYLTGVLDALNLQLVQIEGHTRLLERNSAIEELSKQRLKDFDETRRSIDYQLEKVNKNIAVRSELLSKLVAHQEIYGPDEEANAKKEIERKEAGELKHGWVAVGSTDSGAQGAVQFWAKQNPQGIIVDRIATKDTTGRPDPLSFKSSNTDDMPPEVTCMYRLNKCAGSDNIVRLLNWRSDDTRAAKLEGKLEGFLAYRIYVEYCGSGDLDDLMDKYGYHDFDEPRTTWIPKPFIWATLEALAKAALLMKRGVLDLSKEESDWLFIVHGDLKPGNVFLGNNTSTAYVNYPSVKVGDFGLAMENPYPDPDKFDADKFDYYYRPYGTKGWMAPEQCKFKDDIGVRTQPNSATDIYAIGCLLWTMMKLKPEVDNTHHWKRMEEGDERTPTDFTTAEKLFYGKRLCDIVMKCLRFKPEDRIDPETILKFVKNYTAGAMDELDGLKTKPAHDPSWNKYFIKTQYDKWARGNVLKDMLSTREREEIDAQKLVPPREKRKRDDDDDEDDGSQSSEDYGGETGKKLKTVGQAEDEALQRRVQDLMMKKLMKGQADGEDEDESDEEDEEDESGGEDESDTQEGDIEEEEDEDESDEDEEEEEELDESDGD